MLQEGAPVTTVEYGQYDTGDWGRLREKQPVGGDACYKVRLASKPSRPHTFYATVKKYRDDKPPLGISGKDVYRYVRGTPTGSRLERRTHYHWDWIDKTVDNYASPDRGGAGESVKVQYFANNYSQTHQFTADNYNQWVTISVRCCRLRTGVEGVPVTGFIGAFGVADSERAATIYHYLYDDQDQEGTSGPDTSVVIERPDLQNSPAQEPSPEQASPEQTEYSCVSDAVLADVQGYAGETWRESSDHVERWSRVLAAFGENNSYSNNPMTATEAQTYADRGLPRWVPVVTALQCLETAPEQQPEEQPAQAEAEAEAPTPAPPPATSCVSGTMLDTVRGYYDANKDRAPGYGLNWKRVLIAFGDVSDADQTAFTAAEAKERESRWFGWKPIRQTLECIEAAN